MNIEQQYVHSICNSFSKRISFSVAPLSRNQFSTVIGDFW